MPNKKNNCQIVVAKPVGFCFGVKRAIALAKKQVSSVNDQRQIWTLGPLIHNQEVVSELKSLGVKVVKSVSELKLKVQKAVFSRTRYIVVIRSHGCAPQTIAKIKNLGVEIIDATCPYVKRVQNYASRLRQEGYYIVVIGNKNHPEVKGILGYAQGNLKEKNACVYYPQGDTLPKALIKRLKFQKIGVVGQTTLPLQIFQKSVNLLNTGSFLELRVFNTLCQESLLRQKQCLDLAQKTDMMFVIGARHSANTRTLAAIARTYCPNVWQIENSKDLQQDHIARHLRCGANKKIGIIAGTSTPAVTVADVTKQVKNLIMEADTNGE